MADNDRYQSDDNRDRLGQRDVYMDNRTGVGAQRRGFRAEWGRGRDERYGDRDENYNQPRAENASFRDRDYGQQDGGRTGYRGRDDSRGGNYSGEGGYYTGSAQRFSGESYTSTDRSRYGSFNPSYQSSYGGQGRQYGRNENWQSYPARSNPDFYADENSASGPGWTEDFSGRDRSLSAYRGEDRHNRSNEGGYGGMRNRSYEADYARRDRDHDHGEGRGWWDRAADKVAAWFGGDDSQGYEAGRQSHRGKGPKNYRRSDERVKEDVSDRLSDDHWLDASDIEVMAKEGEVTLSGTVMSRDDKRRAEQLAEQVSGVDNVQNNIRVKKQDDWRSGQSTAMGEGSTGAGSTTSAFGSTSDGTSTSNMGDLGTANAAKGGKTTQ